MKLKKILALACASVMVISSMTACGNNGGSGNGNTKNDGGNAGTTNNGGSAAQEDQSSTDEDAAGDQSGEQKLDYAKADGPIVYWSMWDAGSNQATAIQEVIDEYQKASGNEVQVEWKGRDIRNIIGSSLDAGEAIDIYEDDFMVLSQNDAVFAMDLSEMAEAADYGSKSNEALTSSVRNWADGKLVAIPYQPYASGIFYNKAIFDKAGVTEPATWAEFLDVCKKIKDAGYTPLTLDDAYVTLNLGYHLARYIGQDAVKEVVHNGDWKENENVLKMAQDMEELVKSGYMSKYAPAAYPEGENEVGYEETAMVLNASWVPEEITNQTGCDLEWGMFAYPAVEGGVDGTEAMMIGAQGMSVNKDSKNAQAAFELIMAITTGAGDAKISIASNSIPADPNNTEWPEIIQNCKAAFESSTKGYEWSCGMDDNGDIKTTIGEWAAKLFSGKCTAQEFIDGMEKATK